MRRRIAMTPLYTKEDCGCIHDGTFWVSHCKKHYNEVLKSRRKWRKFIVQRLQDGHADHGH